ncbi:8512_t:CDS:2 [Dentiscutata erythropus]|uniref:8512_t:CDS:1 n=1 Tax=Dentiscutata erythropus TaxID=1348616 RepID=A0A9N8W0W7_9GLOM|nr:8512_t:CDS:2 [Dentiscutata erythropus]
MAGLITFRFIKNDFLAAVAEFLGTAYFLFMGVGGALAFGTSEIGNVGIPFSFGWSLMVNVFLWSPISGGVFNPAITVGLMVTRHLPIVRGILYIIAQFLGALFGSLLIKALVPAPANGPTSVNTSVAQGFFLEMFATSVLTFAVLFIAAGKIPKDDGEKKDKKKGEFMAPFVIGISLFISALSVGPFTGASLNPARTFGPAVVFGNYGNGHWIYYIGTTAGSLLAAGYWYFYTVVFDYEVISGANIEKDEYDVDPSKGDIESR